MDKNAVILKHQQDVVADAEAGISELHTANEDQAQRLAAMQEKLTALGAKPVKKRLSIPKKKKLVSSSTETETAVALTYDEMYEVAKASLIQRGMDPDDLSYSDLISEEELRQIEKELNRALPREEKWTKADFIVVFVAAVIGGVVDFILSNRDRKSVV